MSHHDNEYIKIVKNMIDKKQYVLCPLFDKYSYCRPLTLDEQKKLIDMNKFHDIPHDLQKITLCANYDKVDKYKCYNVNYKNYKYCYDCNIKYKKNVKDKELKNNMIKYFDSDPEDNEDD